MKDQLEIEEKPALEHFPKFPGPHNEKVKHPSDKWPDKWEDMSLPEKIDLQNKYIKYARNWYMGKSAEMPSALKEAPDAFRTWAAAKNAREQNSGPKPLKAVLLPEAAPKPPMTAVLIDPSEPKLGPKPQPMVSVVKGITKPSKKLGPKPKSKGLSPKALVDPYKAKAPVLTEPKPKPMATAILAHPSKPPSGNSAY